MIGTLKIRVHAAAPQLPLQPCYTFVGSPSSIRVVDVPRTIGSWAITAVHVTFSYPDNSIVTADCVQTSGVWTGTIAACAASGSVSGTGVTISADGTDENGDAVTGYVLGRGDLCVIAADATIVSDGVRYNLHYCESEPATPQIGDVHNFDGTFMYYNGTTWVGFGTGVTSINGQSGAVTLTGADIAVSASDATTVAAALAAKAAKTYVDGKSNLVSPNGNVEVEVQNDGNATVEKTEYSGAFSVAFAYGYSISYYTDTYTAPPGGETVTFAGPVAGANGYTYYYDSELGTLDYYDPSEHDRWCIWADQSGYNLMYKTGVLYGISNIDVQHPVLTLEWGEATGDAPVISRAAVTTTDTLAKTSELPTIDSALTKNGTNAVKSSGIWSALWGNITSSFTSIAAWVQDLLSGYLPLSGGTMTGDLVFAETDYGKDQITTHNGNAYLECKAGGSQSFGRIIACAQDIAENVYAKTSQLGIAPWSADTAYAVDAIVAYSGAVYRCIAATTAGILPTNTTYWAVDEFLPKSGGTIQSQKEIRFGSSDFAIGSEAGGGYIADWHEHISAYFSDIINTANGSSTAYAKPADIRYSLGATITASAQLADRTMNRVVPAADNTADIALTFPAAVTGKARDFIVVVTNTTGNSGAITFTTPTGATICGDGFGTAVASGATVMFAVSEVADGLWYTRAIEMEEAS